MWKHSIIALSCKSNSDKGEQFHFFLNKNIFEFRPVLFQDNHLKKFPAFWNFYFVCTDITINMIFMTELPKHYLKIAPLSKYQFFGPRSRTNRCPLDPNVDLVMLPNQNENTVKCWPRNKISWFVWFTYYFEKIFNRKWNSFPFFQLLLQKNVMNQFSPKELLLNAVN